MVIRSRRAPFQVLVLPYLPLEDPGAEGPQLRYALFRRADAGYWQGVAGGGEGDESPREAAGRELQEEAGVSAVPLLALDSRVTMPVIDVTGAFTFGPDVLVVPEYAFGARCSSPDLRLCDEHIEYRWFAYDDARRALRWDSNRSALWELDVRLGRG